MSRIGYCAVVLCALLTTTSFASDEYFQGKLIKQADWKGQAVEYVDKDILIALNKGFTQSDLINELARFDVRISRDADRFGFIQLEATSDAPLFDLTDRIAELESVRFAEPNLVYRTSIIPNDPRFPAQWHYNNTGQDPPGGTPDADIDCPEGWNFTTGDEQIIVGVLDTGIPMQNGSLSHPDLDDPSRFILGLNTFTGQNDPIDGNGHGTHVSGTIGAESNNGIGVAGVTWNCKVMAIKVFNDQGSGTTATFRDGVIYAVDNGCKVLNYSGGGSAHSYSEHGVAYADSHGVILCAAAGNSYHNSVSYPAAYSLQYDNVICVSSVDHNNESSSFSSVGPEVTVSAPGGHGSPFDENDIYSTFPNYDCYLSQAYDLPLNYSPLAGTSMACPHVAGMAALIASVDPTLSPFTIRDVIANSSEDFGTPGWDEEYGYGRINIYNALLELGEINIGHNPLTDTKNFVTDYLVDCSIFSVADLVLDSLLLYYNAGSGWNTYTLQLGRDVSNAHGYIPVQSPGTYIDYYLFAKNVDGARDLTPVYTFKVIDYQIILDPLESEQWAASETEVWYTFTVTNDGVLTDSYNLSVSNNEWNTTIWDSSGTAQVSSSGTLFPDASWTFKVKVDIPATVYAELDSVAVRVESAGDPSILESATCKTISLGAPLSLPFSDEFVTTVLDITKWVITPGVDVSDLGLSEPSVPYALHFDGDPVGADTIVSQVILLAEEPAVNLIYYYQQTGGGESPDYDNDLFVEFYSGAGEWVLLKEHDGADPDMYVFEEVSVPLPAEAHHDQFRVRFRNTASIGERDDWFVDDISIGYSPQISVSTSGSLDANLLPDETAEVFLYVSCAGVGNLHYEVSLEPDFSYSGLFGTLLEQGRVEPASRSYPDEYFSFSGWKGMDDPRVGYDVLFNAGGPDDYGYVWIDSDEPGGPVFDWIDISVSGTSVTGLTDDSYAGPFSIGFAFDYYGETYTEFYISSNGFIGFGPPDNYESLNNEPMPHWDVPNNIIALLWDDLNLQDADNPGAEILYQSTGSQLIVQYVNVPEYGAETGDAFNGEVILKSDGSVRLQYLDFGTGFDKDNCTVGMERVDGLDGLEIVFSGSYLHDALCVVVTTQDVSWLTIEPQSGIVPVGSTDTLTATFNSTGMAAGSYGAILSILSNDPDPSDNPWMSLATLTVQRDYIVGDADGDSNLDVDDAIYLVQFIFASGGPPNPMDSGDADCNGAVDIDDVVFLISYIFSGGPSPCIEDK
ncbi:MAG: S8 family serine peptidase [candidate division Zixibacteria bacterium]|nr:S8 family serine peptidase [candidate division Zixibacteria bacterium]